MKGSCTMPDTLRPYYENELQASDRLLKQGQVLQAWKHLERAHILGQPYAWEHTGVHASMLVFGLKTKNTREFFGQLPRLLAGGLKSWAGTIPVGNTGGANVSPFKPMPIPSDLGQILQAHTSSRA